MKKLRRIIEIARCLKEERQTGQMFHVCAGYLGSRLVGLGFNNYNKQHPYHKYDQYKPSRGGNNYKPCIHAEADLLTRLKIPTKDVTFFSVRLNNNNEVSLAKPCVNCFELLSKKGFRKIIFSIDEKTYSTIC